MKAEEIIARIQVACPWISKDQILKKLEKDKGKTGGFISDETLLRMIAAEFGCTISQKEAPMPRLLFEDLLPGLNDVTVVGRILATFPPKNFEGTRKGKIASILMADKSGILRVVLWNDKTRLLESNGPRVGQIVRFSHGYTREAPSGKAELHVGEKCEISIDPQGVEARDYPHISRFSTKIGELNSSHRNKRFNVVGTVKKIFPTSTFERGDSSRGKVVRFVLSDRTGEIPVVVWNEKVDELEKALQVDARLQLVNAKVKKALGEGLEIHVDNATYAGLLTESEELRIADLKEEQSEVTIEGQVAAKPTIRDVKTAKGELVKLATFELEDETGRMWVSAWRKHADIVSALKLGDRIIIKNAYVKKGFSDQLEISTRTDTAIVFVQ